MPSHTGHDMVVCFYDALPHSRPLSAYSNRDVTDILHVGLQPFVSSANFRV